MLFSLLKKTTLKCSQSEQSLTQVVQVLNSVRVFGVSVTRMHIERGVSIGGVRECHPYPEPMM